MLITKEQAKTNIGQIPGNYYIDKSVCPRCGGNGLNNQFTYPDGGKYCTLCHGKKYTMVNVYPSGKIF